MRKILFILIAFPLFALAQTSGQNYLLTTVFRDTISGNPTHSITYFDGLGRPIQQIAGKQSNTGKDIITHIEYDSIGRQKKEFLPFASTQDNLDYADPSSLVADLVSQYSTRYGDTIPYSEKLFEHSPLNRVLKQAAPGNAWRMGSGHEVKMDYQTNSDTDEVLLLSASTTYDGSYEFYEPTLVSNYFYAAGSLYKTITKDENWTSGNDNTTEEFKDKEGHVILKRTYNNGDPYDTYYVYDEYGNLTYVIPPIVDTGSTITTGILDDLCYQYKYDNRNRLAAKKLPGKLWEYIAYNTQDMPVATGPVLNPFGVSEQGYLITKYDALGRVAYTCFKLGTFDAEERVYVQGQIGTSWKETYIETSMPTIDGKDVNYTNTVYPTSEMKLLTINYYDGYKYDDAPTVPTTVESVKVTTKTKGLATGNWVRVLESPSTATGNLSYTFYDKKGRPIRNETINYLGGTTRVDTKLDFAGKTLLTNTKHKRESSDDFIEVVDAFEYTPEDRVSAHTQKINSLPVESIAINTYDDLGQLIQKNVGNDSIAPYQKVHLKYNIRGWLTNINNIDSLQIGSDPEDLFAFKINYKDDIDNDLSGAVKPLYNGNIAETNWRTSTDNIMRRYGYSYDNLNRLLSATYQKPENTVPVTNMYDETLTYDKNGNIQTLNRNGDFDSNSYSPIEIDDLEYTYDPGKLNQLKKVKDSSASPKGFKDIGSGYEDYTYDNYGNMTSDDNKGITGIIYNHLNLPIKIVFGNGTKIEYLYDATGKKLRKKVYYESPDLITTDYLDGFQYVDEQLNFFPQAEGYVNVTPCAECEEPTKLYDYIYQYKDHLGNIRVSYGYDQSEEVLKIIEENHYYPFGLKHTNYNIDEKKYEPSENPTVTQIGDLAPGEQLLNKYKYNGKEYQDELGLAMYDYGARNYDPALGRWMNIDPLAELYPSITPYNYTANNPVRFVDYDGENFGIEIDHDKKTIKISANYYFSNQGDYDNNKAALAAWSKFTGSYETEDGVVYTISFDLQGKVVAPGSQDEIDAQNDKTGNFVKDEVSDEKFNKEYKLNGGTEDPNGVGGFTKAKEEIVNKKSVAIQQTREHEVGHTLGLNDYEGGGVMTYQSDFSTMSNVTKGNVTKVIANTLQFLNRLSRGERIRARDKTSLRDKKENGKYSGKGSFYDKKSITIN